MEIQTEQQCRICRKRLEITNFYPSKRHKLKVDTKCNECTRKYYRDKYHENPDRQRQYERERKRNRTEAEKDKARKAQRDWSKTTKGRYKSYRVQSKKRNREFSLSLNDFTEIINRNCMYCGEISLGIDRLDNKLGYTLNNSKPCCGECNKMKRDMSFIEFIKKCHKISQTYKDIPFPDDPDPAPLKDKTYN